MLPLSGFAAQWGIPSQKGINIMGERINAQGGYKVGGKSYRIKLVEVDTEGNTEIALSKGNRLIHDEKIKFIIGPIFCGEVSALQSISEPNKILTMVYCFSPQALGPDKPYTFRLYSSGRENMAAMYPFLKKFFPKVKTLGMSGLADEKETVELCVKMAEEAGFKVISIEHVPPGTSDWFPVLTKVVAKNPDAFIPVSAPPPEAGMIIQQKHQLGYKGLVISPSHYDPNMIVAKAGAEAAEGFISMGPDFTGPNARPGLRYLYEKYTEKYKEFDPVSQASYGWLEILKIAIEKAGTLDTAGVIKTMENLEGEFVKGRFSFGGVKTYGIKRQIIEPVDFSAIKNGKHVYLGAIIPSVP